MLFNLVVLWHLESHVVSAISHVNCTGPGTGVVHHTSADCLKNNHDKHSE